MASPYCPKRSGLPRRTRMSNRGPGRTLGPDLLWFLDGRRLPRETRRLFVSSGRHELLCVSPGGTHARASFEVRCATS